MNVFFDTEFTGLHKNTTLISIGIIAENENSFYAELSDFDRSQAGGKWLHDNVISKLEFLGKTEHYSETDKPKGTHIDFKGPKCLLKPILQKWFAQFDSVEMWSDVLSYDWVLFQDIFGGAFEMPRNIYYIPFDLATSLKENGIDPDISREQFVYGKSDNEPPAKHHALWDACAIKMAWEKLQLIKQANNRVVRNADAEEGFCARL